MLQSILVPIHSAGWPFILLFFVGAIILSVFSSLAGLIGILLTLWCTYFFRNPDRITPTRPGLIVSPADGVVQMIVKAVPPHELEMGEKPLIRIAVFMNVFNVHVNRCPVGGKITVKHYHPGKFFNASLDKASELNERMCLKATMDDNREVGFVQIAGLIARRIECFVSVGDHVSAGERFGLIRFGSRVDIYLPDGVAPLVCVGQTAIAGETVIADIGSEETARFGSKI